MGRVWFVVGFLAVAPFLSVSASAQRRVARPREGLLILQGTQQGPEVFIDEERLGTMPIDPIALLPGDHTVRVTQPGYTDFTDVVTIESDRTVTMDVELLAVAGILDLETNPPGAHVFIDEHFMGESPLTADLNEGAHQLRLRLSGYAEIERSIVSAAGVTERLVLSLEALPEPEQHAGTPWYEEPVTWIAVGSGVVAITVGAVLAAVLTQPSSSAIDGYCMGTCVRLQEGR